MLSWLLAAVVLWHCCTTINGVGTCSAVLVLPSDRAQVGHGVARPVNCGDTIIRAGRDEQLRAGRTARRRQRCDAAAMVRPTANQKVALENRQRPRNGVEESAWRVGGEIYRCR